MPNRAKPQNRLERDEDKARIEAKLGKLAKARRGE